MAASLKCVRRRGDDIFIFGFSRGNVWRLKSLTSEAPDQRVYYSQGVGTLRGAVVRGGVAGYGIDDLRLFFEGDLRFLRQFN